PRRVSTGTTKSSRKRTFVRNAFESPSMSIGCAFQPGYFFGSTMKPVMPVFAKISSHSVDDGPCHRDRAKARPGTLDSESEIARPTAWGRDPEAHQRRKGAQGGRRPDPRVPSVVNGLGCVRPPVGCSDGGGHRLRESG